MAKRKKPGEELDRAERQRAVIALLREGLSFREIGGRLGISKSAAHRRYKEVVAQLPAVQDLREHRAEVFADVELLIENLRPFVHDDEVRPRSRDMAVFMACIETKMRVIGLYDPPPPAPVDQRGTGRTHASTDEHVGPHGRGMWSKVLG